MRHQFDNKDIVFDKVCQKELAVQVQPKSVLEAFEYIVELAENTNLNTNFFDKAAIYIRFMQTETFIDTDCFTGSFRRSKRNQLYPYL